MILQAVLNRTAERFNGEGVNTYARCLKYGALFRISRRDSSVKAFSQLSNSVLRSYLVCVIALTRYGHAFLQTCGKAVAHSLLLSKKN